MQLEVKTTTNREVVDVTKDLEAKLSGKNGVVVLNLLHTTAGLTTAVLDPGTDQDFLEFLKGITPKVEWRHPHDPEHTPDHLLASLIGSSVALPLQNGKLVLGTWQRVVLVELSGSRNRNINISILEGN